MADEDKTLEELSRDLRESKARLEEAQRIAHVGHYYWNLIANRVIWSDELRLFIPKCVPTSNIVLFVPMDI